MADLPEGFDLEALLAPIPGDAPQGIDIREDFSATSPYNRLRDARSEARDAERGQDEGEADARDPDAAVAHGARARAEDAGGDHQGPGGRRLADRGDGAQPRACRPDRRCAAHGGPRRTLLGRPVPAARRLRHGDARLAGDRAQRSRRQRLADPAAVHDRAVRPAGRHAGCTTTSISSRNSSRRSMPNGASSASRPVPCRSTTWSGGARRGRGAGSPHCWRTPGRRATPGRRWPTRWTRRPAPMVRPPPRCATCCRASSTSPRATRRPRRRQPAERRRPSRGSGVASADGRRPAVSAAIAASPGQAGLARGRAARAGRDRQFLPPHRTALAALLHAGRGGAPRPHDLARTAGRRSSPTRTRATAS